ncbi:kinase-like domain-containing protein [Nemania abortiva]|nr:kinase-like domain-containing protein [Nemania abortiva]
MIYWAGLPEFVRDSRLEAQVYALSTVHSIYDRQTGSSQQQIWYRDTSVCVGRGGQGKVWLERRALHSAPYTMLQRAVKEIELDKPIDRDEDRLRELEALAKFSRPRYLEFIVESYGWYLKSENLLCIAMEYCKLGDLARYLELNGRLAEGDANLITKQVLAGLNFMHNEGWAHRDLKLSNILITRQPPERWGVKISDLGLSKRAQSHMYDSTTVKGTPGLLAPELAGFMGVHASRTADPKAVDMWCLGGTVYEMVTGLKPFADLSSFFTYCNGRRTISEGTLVGYASPILVDFIQSLMWVEPRSRIDVAKAWRHQWIKDFPIPTLPPSQNPISSANRPEIPLHNAVAQPPPVRPYLPSGSWSTSSDLQPTNYSPRTPTLYPGFSYNQRYLNSKYYRGHLNSEHNQEFLRRQHSTPRSEFPPLPTPGYTHHSSHSSPSPHGGLNSQRRLYSQVVTTLSPAVPLSDSSPAIESGDLQYPPIANGTTAKPPSKAIPIVDPTAANREPGPSQPPKQVSSITKDEEMDALDIRALRKMEKRAKKPQDIARAWALIRPIKNAEFIAFSKTFKLSTPVPQDLINIVTNDPAKRASLVEEFKQPKTTPATATSIAKDTSTSTTNHNTPSESFHANDVSTSQKHSKSEDWKAEELIDIGSSSVVEQLKDIEFIEEPHQNDDWQTVDNKKKRRNGKGPTPPLIS